MDVEKIIREYLPQIVHMSLGTSKDNKPWVCEVHFVYDDNLNLYFRSKSDRRHSQEIAANPNVAGNIVKQHTLSDQPVGVYFEGTAEHMSDELERQKVDPLFQERLQAGPGILDEAKDPSGHQFYKITVDTFYIFGNFGDGTKKYELKWNGGTK